MVYVYAVSSLPNRLAHLSHCDRNQNDPCAACSTASVTCEHPKPELDGRKRKKGTRAVSAGGGNARSGGSERASTGSPLRQDSAGPTASTSSFQFDPMPIPNFFDQHSQHDFASGGSSLDLLSNLAMQSPSSTHPAFSMATSLPTISAAMLPPPLPPNQDHEPSASSGSALHFTARHESDPAPSPVPLLHYFRPFGPTAIQPGLEQINLDFAVPPSQSRVGSPALETSSHNGYNASYFSLPPASTRDRLFDDGSDVPKPEVLDELYPLFFSKMGSHFPFLTERELRALDGPDDSSLKRLDAPLLINCVCAMAARSVLVQVHEIS